MDDWVMARHLAKHPGPFQVGDRVSYVRGARPVEGVIIEDRGHPGVGGRRVYRLRVRLDEWNEIATEHPFDVLTLVAAAPANGAGGPSRE